MKKSGFWTLVLSLIPGGGLMYLGYLKKGLQYMLMFGGSFWLALLFDNMFRYQMGDWIMSLFIIVAVVIWLFQFFDAMHTRVRMKRLEIDVPADDGFFYPQNLFTNSPLKKISAAKSFAAVLIVLGSAWLLSLVMDMARRYLIDEIRVYVERANQYLFPVLISLGLMVAGFRLLRGGKKRNGGSDKEGE